MTESAQGRSYLRRLLDLLVIAVTDSRGPMQLTELAHLAQIPLSTASRLAGLLVDMDMLRVMPDGRIDVGPELVHLAVKAMDRVNGDSQQRAAVAALAKATGESASAGLLIGDAIVLVARDEPAHSLRAVAHVGDIISPHTSAMGKAILARLDAERRLAVLRRAAPDEAEELSRRLDSELAEVRQAGYAIDEEMFAVGLRCRAAALLDGSGQAYGGISVGGPASRFTYEQATQSLPQLLAIAAELSLTKPGENTSVARQARQRR